MLAAVKEEALDKLGYFLTPSELFSEMARRGNAEGKESWLNFAASGQQYGGFPNYISFSGNKLN